MIILLYYYDRLGYNNILDDKDFLVSVAVTIIIIIVLGNKKIIDHAPSRRQTIILYISELCILIIIMRRII